MGNVVVTKLEQVYSLGGLYKELYVYFTGSTSYATGGDSLTARDCGLTTIQGIEAICHSADRLANPVFVGNAPEDSVKLLMTDLAGTEIVAAVDMSTKAFRARVTGLY